MIKNHQDHITNTTRTGEDYLATSKLPRRIQEALNKGRWAENGITGVAESYTRRPATIYIQPSKTHHDRYAIVIDYDNGKPSKTAGVDGDTLIKDLT